MSEKQETPEEFEGITHEDIVAAVAILREDMVIKQGRESREAIKGLEERMNLRDEEDRGRWDKWEERTRGPLTPENDPGKSEGVPPAPPPVEASKPVEDGGKVKEKRRKGVWFASSEDEMSKGEGEGK